MTSTLAPPTTSTNGQTQAAPSPASTGTPASTSGGAAPAGGATSLSKASIVNIDSGKTVVECMFNPKEYTFNKSNNWEPGKAKGNNIPPLEFTRGDATVLTLQLVFDTYAEGADVRSKYTDAIWNLMRVDPKLKDQKNKKARPPKVRFLWGKSAGSKTWAFDAVITKIQQKFTLFLPDGTPVRSTLDVTFQQIKDDGVGAPLPGQNPTSGALDSLRLWTVQEGDTLAWIAYQEYGDPNEWRRIADRNRLTQVRSLRPGAVLELPSA